MTRPQPPEPSGHPPDIVETQGQIVRGILYEDDPRMKSDPRVILMEEVISDMPLLTGIGGEINPGEDVPDAMARKWKEISGSAKSMDWNLFAILSDTGHGAKTFFLRAQLPKAIDQDIQDNLYRSEKFTPIEVENVWRGDVIWYIPWAVHLGMDQNVSIAKVSCEP